MPTPPPTNIRGSSPHQTGYSQSGKTCTLPATHASFNPVMDKLPSPPLPPTSLQRTVTDEVFDIYLNTLDTESKQAQKKVGGACASGWGLC